MKFPLNLLTLYINENIILIHNKEQHYGKITKLRQMVPKKVRSSIEKVQ